MRLEVKGYRSGQLLCTAVYRGTRTTAVVYIAKWRTGQHWQQAAQRN